MGTVHGDDIPWPPRAPYPTPTDLLLGGPEKDKVQAYIPPMTTDLQELCDKTVNTIALVDIDLLRKKSGTN
jgi:hypothetical protein